MAKSRLGEIASRSDFRWKTQDGDLLTLEEMTASHLFFCIRMIWNNSVHESLKLHPYRKWNLGANSSRYAKALPFLVGELAKKKNDLTPWMLNQLEWISLNSGALKDGFKNVEEIENG